MIVVTVWIFTLKCVFQFTYLICNKNFVLLLDHVGQRKEKISWNGRKGQTTLWFRDAELHSTKRWKDKGQEEETNQRSKCAEKVIVSITLTYLLLLRLNT